MQKSYKIISTSRQLILAVPFVNNYSKKVTPYIVQHGNKTFFPEDAVITNNKSELSNYNIVQHSSKAALSLRTSIYASLVKTIKPSPHLSNEYFSQGTVIATKNNQIFFIISNNGYQKQEKKVLALSATMQTPELPYYRDIVCTESLWYMSCIIAHDYQYPLNEYNPNRLQPVVNMITMHNYNVDSFLDCKQIEVLTQEDFEKFYHVFKVFLKDLLKTQWKN